MAIKMTDKMKQVATIEAQKRDYNIHHHFELKYMTGEQRDVVGFLGEFACKEYLGLDWYSGIRDNYETIDDGDILLSGLTVDIKTETIPKETLMKLIRGQVQDDEPYGRRLINEGQIPLLSHYDYIVWGAFSRNMYDLWFHLGYLETKYILNNYEATIETPYGRKYNEPCINVRQSELKDINELKRILGQSK